MSAARRTVITYGTFDLLHEGHVNLLRRAREQGGRLIVGVTDPLFDMRRGKLETHDSLQERVDAVRATGLADQIVVERDEGQKVRDVARLGVDVLVAGDDWRGRLDHLAGLCEVVYLPRTPGVSSSARRATIDGRLSLGIVGSGRIARRFVAEARAVAGVRVAGTYNPNYPSARTFCDELDAGCVALDFDDLLACSDAVYIASPHQTHARYARLALEAGRHVLCEKPMALSRDDARELLDLADARGLVLMEAIKTAYCPGFIQAMDLVASGAIGRVVDVDARFSRLTPPGPREREDAAYGGAFLEFGSYVGLPAMRLLGVSPKAVEFARVEDEKGIDLYTKALLHYDGAVAALTCGLGAKTHGTLTVAGTQGCLVVEAPWWKTARFQIQREDPDCIERYESTYLGDGLRYEIAELVHRVRRHAGHPARIAPEESCGIAALMEAFLAERRLP